MKNVLKVCLVLFTLIPSFTNASFTKIEGLYEDARGWYQWKELILGSGISYWALQMIQPKVAQAGELTELEQIKMWILTIAQEYKIDSEGLEKLAVCESKMNPRAYNPDDVDGRPKYGLFQYDTNTYVGKNIWDWKSQTEQTAQWIVKGYWKKWPW